MTKDEVMKLALEALQADELDMVDDGSGNMIFRKEQAITAIKEALAQPTPAEYAIGYAEGFEDACKKPTWVGLTDEERKEIWWSCEQQTPTTFVKAIEQALKEKNT